MKLKYLFHVEYLDGTTLSQTQEDKSSLDDKRNAFYDVLSFTDKKIKRITYTQQRLFSPTTVIVDHLTGNFIVNGVEIIPEAIVDPKTDKPHVVLERLPVRYMTVLQNFNMTYNPSTFKLLNAEPTGEERTFFVGWKTRINRKTYTRVIGVK